MPGCPASSPRSSMRSCGSTSPWYSRRRQVRDVDVVALAQRGEHVVAAIVRRRAAAGAGQSTWKSRSFTGPGGTNRSSTNTSTESG